MALPQVTVLMELHMEEDNIRSPKLIFLKDILETTRPAEDFADAIGLEAEGDGMWSDPHTGKVTHRIDHGRLTKVDPDGPSETNRLLRRPLFFAFLSLLSLLW